MNQIINMIIRQITRQLVNRGVNAGFDQAAKLGKRRQQPQGEIDDYGNPVEAAPQMSREERRQKRQARQAARNARQSMKVAQRMSKF